MTDMLRDLVERLNDVTELARAGLVVKQGVVTGVSPLRVRLANDSSALPYIPITAIPDLKVGERLLCMVASGTVTVLQVFGRPTDRSGNVTIGGALDVGGKLIVEGRKVVGNTSQGLAADLNNVLTAGVYAFDPSTLNAPSGSTWGIVRVFITGGDNETWAGVGSWIWQEATTTGAYPVRWLRNRINAGAWNAWYPQNAFATVSQDGLARAASQAQVNAGTDPQFYLTSSTLRNRNYAAYAEAAGSVGAVSVPAQGDVQTTVTFPSGRFSATPIVVATLATPIRDMTVAAVPVNASSFTLSRGSVSTVARSVAASWHAVQMTSGSGAG